MWFIAKTIANISTKISKAQIINFDTCTLNSNVITEADILAAINQLNFHSFEYFQLNSIIFFLQFLYIFLLQIFVSKL